uniref:Uncharacterized protein n=1 Tax=Nothoprocta perdicaria TaxID=30464 RepID=A0A8C6Z2V1_NOTPE
MQGVLTASSQCQRMALVSLACQRMALISLACQRMALVSLACQRMALISLLTRLPAHASKGSAVPRSRGRPKPPMVTVSARLAAPSTEPQAC